MRKVIISDTSSLIVLQKIDELELLKILYSEIIITPEIKEEYGDRIPDWITIKAVKDKKYQEFLETQIDKGEASAIALAVEVPKSLLLLDDLKARKLAKKLNLNFTGTLGVLHRAKKENAIKRIKPLLVKIQETDFRISQNIIDELLRINNEQ